jgi:hypothetical protein
MRSYDASSFSPDHDEWKDTHARELLELAASQSISGAANDAVHLDALSNSGALRCTQALLEAAGDAAW